jgi:glycosyltransferase involved in cell wall biosynthesis
MKLRQKHTKVLFYFVSIPIYINNNGDPKWNSSATSKLLNVLITLLKNEVNSGKVIIGVETHQLKLALNKLTGIKISYLPQPAELLSVSKSNNTILMACYGAARHEKGSNILQLAVAKYLELHPDTKSKFIIQWIDDFKDENSKLVKKIPVLTNSSRVGYISHYFKDDEYKLYLSQTNVLLLPYRRSSYQLRGSRVLIEAMQNGIPVVVTEGTTLSEQAMKFGASVTCKDGDIESLVKALHLVEANYLKLKQLAEIKKQSARDHFSVKEFRRLLLA